jgi:outer membrane murein-binding lipoprotein Lpp
MKKIAFSALIILTVISSLIFSSCQASGVPRSQYDQLNAQVADLQSRLAKAQSDFNKLQSDKVNVDNQLKNAQFQITSLQSQVSQASLTGATPAETATKIVKYYHDTHVYSAYDLFVCSDMASEVWNMLKAQNISSVIVVGDVDVAITDILQSDHAWVVATVGAGDYLALETTGGYTVKKSEHPLYYRGWAFNSPADLKSHNDWVKEYNVRVGFRNQLNTEANKGLTLMYGNPTDAAKYKAVYDKLVELRTVQETTLNSLMSSINQLATPVSY